MKRGPRTATVLKRLSLAELRTAVQKRHHSEAQLVQRLSRERAALLKRVETIEARIAEGEAALRAFAVPAAQRVNGRRRRRSGRKNAAVRAPKERGRQRVKLRRARQRPTIKDLAATALGQMKKPLHQRDLAQLLLKKHGVKSKSAHFDRSLGLMLSQDKRFKRTGRATYTLR